MITATLPTEPGFYWHRASPDAEWFMVAIDRCSGVEGSYLHAYDVEGYTFSGRPLIGWAEHLPIGEWTGPLEKPSTAAELDPEALARRFDAAAAEWETNGQIEWASLYRSMSAEIREVLASKSRASDPIGKLHSDAIASLGIERAFAGHPIIRKALKDFAGEIPWPASLPASGD